MFCSVLFGSLTLYCSGAFVRAFSTVMGVLRVKRNDSPIIQRVQWTSMCEEKYEVFNKIRIGSILNM